MKTVLGGVAVASLLLLAGCGSEPHADPEPAPSTAPTATEASAAATTAHLFPDDFPLLTGLPVDAPVEGDRYGPAGPSRALPPLVPTACGDSVAIPPHVDLLRAAWTNVEDDRERQLVAFATTAEATAYVDAVLDLYRRCPGERLTSRDTLHSTVVDSDLGHQAGAVSVLATYRDAPRPGLLTLHVVRVSRFVLLSETYDESGAGPNPAAQAADHRDADADALGGVVTDMSVLDNAGERPWFGPQGYGAVRLGMTRTDLLALAHTRLTGDGRCATFTTEATDAGIEPGVSGIIETGRGVSSLTLQAPSSTPEGIGRGASYDAVRAAYPHAEGDRDLLTADAPGHPDRSYRFELGPDGVVSVALVLHHQECAG